MRNEVRPQEEALAPAALGESVPFDESAAFDHLRGIGARFDPEVLKATREIYREAVKALPWSDRRSVQDAAYGPHERHRLDIYAADQPSAPIVVFLHGGGFVGGDKRGDPVFYANVGRYFAAHGFMAVLANYRLAPAATWPSGIEDVAAVVEWIQLHAAEHGGDANRIVLIGQSAGAAHVAGYLFDPHVRPEIHASICGAALMSGFYRPKSPLVGGPLAYFGNREEHWPDRAVASKLRTPHPPLLLSVAEFDPAPIADQTLDFAMSLNMVNGCAPRLLWFEGHNHVSTVHGLGLGSDTVGLALRNFAERVTR